MRHVLQKTLIWLALTASPAAAAPLAHGRAATPRGLDAGLAAELRGHADPRLDALRAGRTGAGARLMHLDREALRAAQADSPGLAELRGGISAGSVVVAALLILVIVLII